MYLHSLINTLFPPGGDNYKHQITNMLTSKSSYVRERVRKKYIYKQKQNIVISGYELIENTTHYSELRAL